MRGHQRVVPIHPPAMFAVSSAADRARLLRRGGRTWRGLCPSSDRGGPVERTSPSCRGCSTSCSATTRLGREDLSAGREDKPRSRERGGSNPRSAPHRDQGEGRAQIGCRGLVAACRGASHVPRRPCRTRRQSRPCARPTGQHAPHRAPRLRLPTQELQVQTRREPTSVGQRTAVGATSPRSAPR